MARLRAANRITATRGSIAIAVGVILLAVAVGALSVLALRQVRPTSEPPAYPAATYSFAPRTPAPSTAPHTRPAPAPTAARTTPSARPSATPNATPSTAAAPGAAERFLAAGADGLWRATAGACGGTAPVIERSSDGGATWQNVTPAAQPVTQVRELTALAPQAATTVVDLGASCQTMTVRTYTDGRFWEPYPDLFAADSFARADGLVVLAGRSVAAPCADPWGLRRASDGTTALICDGTAYLRSGDTWSALTASAHALAVTRGAVVVARTDASCRGILLTTYEPGARDLGCIEADATQPTALDTSATGVVVWSGDRIVTVG